MEFSDFVAAGLALMAKRDVTLRVTPMGYNMGQLQQMPVAVLSHPRALCLIRRQSSMINCTALSIPFKICTKCGVNYPATQEFFSRQNSGLFGVRAYCKMCQAAERRAYRERIESQPKPEHRKCGECGRILPLDTEHWHVHRGSPHGFRQPCKECRNANSWDKRNPERKRENDRRWYRERGWRARKRYIESGMAAANKRRYRRTQKGKLKVAAYNARRRARILQAKGSHTAEDVRLIGELQGWRCWWCGEDCSAQYHADHRIPLAKGGSNGPGNIVVSCPSCNLSKRDKMPHEWCGRLL